MIAEFKDKDNSETLAVVEDSTNICNDFVSSPNNFPKNTVKNCYSKPENLYQWKLYKRYDRFLAIISSLNDEIDENWALTPLRGKRPYRKDWQHEQPVERGYIKKLLKEGEKAVSKKGKPYTAYISGIGLRTGKYSGNLLAIDIDGESALTLLQSMGEIPQTVSWTSGKKGRSQLLFKVPLDIEFTRKVVTKYKELKTLPGEALEFRYNECQSALPPSYHPNTGYYKWLNSPVNCEVAIAPKWLCKFLLSCAKEEQETEEEKTRKKAEREERRRNRHLLQLSGNVKLEDILQQSGDRLGIDAYDWGGHNFYEMRGRLEGCCPNHVSASGRSFHVNTNTLEWYCFGCGVGGHIADYKHFVATGNIKPRGKDFVEIVKNLAKDANIEFPNLKNKDTPQEYPGEKGKRYHEKNRFKTWLRAVAEGLGKTAYKGFGQFCNSKKNQSRRLDLSSINKIHYKTDAPIDWEYCAENNIKIIYQKGQRAEVWAKATNQLILDTSATGTAKSHDSGLFSNEQGKVWILDKNHRNPTTATVEKNKTDIPTRNLGLIQDLTRQTPLGNYYLENVEKGVIPSIPPNCHQADLFWLLAHKNYDIYQNIDNPLCTKCPFFKQCAVAEGYGYGYKHQKKNALAHQEVRGHIDSLPGVNSYDYSKDIAIVDEAQTLLKGTKTITASLVDFDRVFISIALNNKTIFDQLLPYLSKLKTILDKCYKLPKYGYNHQKVIEILGTPPENLAEIIEGLLGIDPKLESLIETPNKVYDSNFKEASSMANSIFRKEAREQTKKNLEELPVNFLVSVLKIWNGDITGAIRISPRHQLKITFSNRHHGSLLTSFKKVLLLDATGDREKLARIIGKEKTNGAILQGEETSPNLAPNILTIAQSTPKLKNLQVIGVKLQGLGSSDWSQTAQKRIEALVKELSKKHSDLEVISLKKYSNNKGYWFKDNRGTNRYKGARAIAAFGKPYINLGAAEDEYLALYGSLSGFSDYYKSLMQREIKQLVGRQRAHLYPDCKFYLYICAPELDLDFLEDEGIKLIYCDAFSISNDAGTTGQFRRSQLVEVIKQLVELGEPISQKRIASLMGLSQSGISKLTSTIAGGWRTIKKLLPLYIKSNRTSNIFQTAEIKEFILNNLEENLIKWLKIITEKGIEIFTTVILAKYNLEIRGLIIAILYSIVLSEDQMQEILSGLSPPKR